MKMRLALIAGACLLALAAPVRAQTTRTSTNASGSITTTNTFQSVIAQNMARQGCTIENTGTNTMYVFFGPIAGATKAKSQTIATGAFAYCDRFGMVRGDQVSITGTTTETFYADFQ